MPTTLNRVVHNVICHECKPLHETIVKEFYAKLNDPQTHKSHLFNGRYENIYIAEDHLPALRPVLKNILCEAARHLKCDEDQLRLGFWFNLMQKDDVTLPHRHDDDDELLSGAYYIQMPEGSGHLRISGDKGVVDIEPVESTLVFFPPSFEHEVTRHESGKARISIGFNIGPKIKDEQAVAF